MGTSRGQNPEVVRGLQQCPTCGLGFLEAYSDPYGDQPVTHMSCARCLHRWKIGDLLEAPGEALPVTGRRT